MKYNDHLSLNFIMKKFFSFLSHREAFCPVWEVVGSFILAAWERISKSWSINCALFLCSVLWFVCKSPSFPLEGGSTKRGQKKCHLDRISQGYKAGIAVCTYSYRALFTHFWGTAQKLEKLSRFWEIEQRNALYIHMLQSRQATI